MTRAELLSKRRQIAAIKSQILDAQALVQRLMVEQTELEAELRGYQCARRRRKKP